MKVLALFFLLFFSFISFTQRDKSYRYIPYFQTLKANKLAYHLTKNLKSDSEKVVAIHDWITHTIEFDVNRWLSFDYSPTPINKILFKRKAISTDYSRLFEELCKFSNIKCISIKGYTKNEYIDYLDKFYLDEQMWNAVKINNNWYLVDACLDAGKVEYYKRTFSGYFIFAFSLGTSDRLVYKPHFSSQPSEKYFCKNGYFFKTDHFPSNPIWQFTNPLNLIESFEKDSSSYFQKFDSTSENLANDDYSIKRDNYFYLSKKEREISDGFISFTTNPRNNLNIANACYNQAVEFLGKINKDSNSKENIVDQYNSITIILLKSKIHCDTTNYFFKNQKNEALANNLKKKEIITQQNKKLIKSTEESIKTINSGLKVGIAGKITLKTMLEKNKISAFKIKHNKNFKKTNFAYKTNFTDSIQLSLSVKKFHDSVEISKTKLAEKFEKISNIHQDFTQKMELYATNCKKNNQIAKDLCNLRLDFNDDLDYSIRKLKDSLIIQKNKTESLLITENRLTIINYFQNEFNSLNKDFTNFYSYSTYLDAEYCKLKKSIRENNQLKIEYKEVIDSFEKDYKLYNSILKTYKKKFNQIFKISKAQVPLSKAEKHTYTKEQFIEYQMNTIRSSFINKHYKECLSETKALKTKINKLNKKIEKDLKKIKVA